jgi:hypothetical protein
MDFFEANKTNTSTQLVLHAKITQMIAFQKAFTESLILAQDERWRRA